MLLSCRRIFGSHTGERIAAAILENYSIKQRIDYIITNSEYEESSQYYFDLSKK